MKHDDFTSNMTWILLARADIWLEAWYYLPPDFAVNSWVNLHRAFTERIWENGVIKDDFQGGAGISVWSHVSGNVYRIEYGVNGNLVGEHIVGWGSRGDDFTSGTITLGTWFKITTYVHRDLTNGIFQLWLNDNLEVNLTNIRTIGADPARIAVLPEHGGPNKAWLSSGIALYTGDLPNISPKEIRVDDVVLSYG